MKYLRAGHSTDEVQRLMLKTLSPVMRQYWRTIKTFILLFIVITALNFFCKSQEIADVCLDIFTQRVSRRHMQMYV